MKPSFSKSTLVSSVGAVLPLHLGFDSEAHKELAAKDIKWSVDSDAVSLRTFDGDDRMSFSNGVLVIFSKVGKATVTAELDGEKYTCAVTVNEQVKESSDGIFNYYIGDLHDHSGNYHDREQFADRTEGFQDEYLNCVKNEGLMDFGVISDHAQVVNDTDFFRGFTECEKAEPMCAVIFPGAESEVKVTELDRFGIERRRSGEIVTFGAAGYAFASSWDEFTDAFEGSPTPVGIFAHPQIIGYSTKGIWDFDFAKNNSEKMLRIIRGVEMGDGSPRNENLIHELAFSRALDSGFRVSTTCSSDSHGPSWGYARFPGKTVVMAKEKTREAFIDAFRNNRFYATESGNVKIRYSVNGSMAPCTLPETDTYDFCVELSFFSDDETTVPNLCKVISDGGKTVSTVTDFDPSGFEFTVKSETASYFYLRFSDVEERRTWSVPVWCGRTPSVKTDSELSPVPFPEGASARELISGKDASAVIDGSPDTLFFASATETSVLIDLTREVSFRGIGYLPEFVSHDKVRRTPKPYTSTNLTARMPAEFEIFASCDGEAFTKLTDGVFRNLGGEEIVPFDKTNARYIRIDIKNNVGELLKPACYGARNTVLCNFTLFDE